METFKKETEPKIGFDPKNLEKMYKAYLKHAIGKEEITDRNGTIIKEVDFSISRKDGKPIAGHIELTINMFHSILIFCFQKHDQCVNVRMTCSRSSKPDEYIEKGYEKYIWTMELKTECIISSGYEVGDINAQFKSYSTEKVNIRWEQRFDLLSFVINDFNKNYRV